MVLVYSKTLLHALEKITHVEQQDCTEPIGKDPVLLNDPELSITLALISN